MNYKRLVSQCLLWFVTILSLSFGSFVLYDPQQFYVAICLFLTGLTTLFIIFEIKMLGILCSALILTISAIAYLKRFSLFQSFEIYMTPNTALCFILLGLSLLLMNLPKRLLNSYLIQAMCGAIMAIATAAIFGYLVQSFTLSNWLDFIGMSFHIACALLLISLAIFIYESLLEFPLKSFSLEPILWIAFLVATLTILFWEGLRTYEFENFNQANRLNVEYITNNFKAYFQQTDNAFIRFSKRIPYLDKTFLKQDLQNYLNDFSWLTSLKIYNKNLELLENASKDSSKFSNEVLENIKNNDQILFIQDDTLYLIYPIENTDQNILIAEVSLPILMEKTLLPYYFKYFNFSIFFKDKLIYAEHIGPSETYGEPIIKQVDTGIGPLIFKVLPTQEFLKLHQTFLPTYIIIRSIVATIILSIAVLFGQMTAITKNRLAEALKEKEETLAFRNAILDSSIYSIISTDSKGKIRIFNNAAERMLGYKAEEMIGKSPEVFHDTEEIAKRAQELSLKPGFEVFVEQAKRELHEEREWTYIDKKGNRFPVMLSVTPVKNEKGKILGFLGIAYDITQIKVAEQMKNKLIAITSHELRSPLASIRTSLDMINATDPEQQHILNIAKRGCDRLIRLTSDILDIQKMEAGQMQFQSSEFQLPVLIAQAIEANQALAQENKEEIRCANSPPDIKMVGDFDRLMQVMNNLIVNAIKYSPQGSVISLHFAQKDDKIRVSIKDQGTGIPDTYVPLLFQKFTQLPGGKKGTGLGLSIAKAIIEKHHGQIGVDTSPQGNTFWFELPIAY